jgi:hypothetical protein
MTLHETKPQNGSELHTDSPEGKKRASVARARRGCDGNTGGGGEIESVPNNLKEKRFRVTYHKLSQQGSPKTFSTDTTKSTTTEPSTCVRSTSWLQPTPLGAELKLNKDILVLDGSSNKTHAENKKKNGV